jgi:L-iditol 2-dehydrogenase
VGVKPGETAVVVGAGLIGLLVIQALKNAGCAKVFAVDRDEKRLTLAKALGADAAFHSNDGDVAGKIRALTGGDGADISMEVVGLTPTIRLAIACVRKGGRVGAVGNIQADVEFPLQEIVTREISVLGSCAAGTQYPVALRKLAEGSIEVEPLISAKAPLEEGAAWFDRLYRGDEGLLKVILTP